MMGKYADKSGSLTPQVTGCRDNDRLPGVLLNSGRNHRCQVAYSHEIVSCGREGEHPAHPFYASVTRFPEIACCFDPAEDFLHPFAQALTDGVARVPIGPAVNAALGLVSDATIVLTGAKARECPKPLRRIAYQDSATGKIYVFLTNHFRLAAKTIADIYLKLFRTIRLNDC